MLCKVLTQTLTSGTVSMGASREERGPVRIARSRKGRVLYSAMIALRFSILPHPPPSCTFFPCCPLGVLFDRYTIIHTAQARVSAIPAASFSRASAGLLYTTRSFISCHRLIDPASFRPPHPSSSVPHTHHRAHATRAPSERAPDRTRTRDMSWKMPAGASRWRAGCKTRGDPGSARCDAVRVPSHGGRGSGRNGAMGVVTSSLGLTSMEFGLVCTFPLFPFFPHLFFLFFPFFCVSVYLSYTSGSVSSLHTGLYPNAIGMLSILFH